MPDSPSAPRSARLGLRLSLFGKNLLFPVDGGETVPHVLASGKPLALLAYLNCAPELTVSREQLIELLWSDAPPEKGRHTLRQTFWYTRRKIGTDPFRVVGDNVSLTEPLTSDRDALLAALDADDPDSAIGLYTGDFFPDFAAPGGAGFEQSADLERTRLRSLFLGAATRVVRDRLGNCHAFRPYQCPSRER